VAKFKEKLNNRCKVRRRRRNPGENGRIKHINMNMRRENFNYNLIELEHISLPPLFTLPSFVYDRNFFINNIITFNIFMRE
jgi:hypothetical protein